MQISYFDSTQVRRLIRIVMLLGMSSFLAIGALAVPPNDKFADAILIPSTPAFIGDSNVGATKQTNEPNHAKNFGGASVWYKYTAQNDGVMTLDARGTDFNTLLAVYVGDLATGLTLVAENDDYLFGGGYYSAASVVVFGVKAGTTYYIAIDGKNKFDSTGAQSGDLDVDVSFASSGENDNFSSAFALSTTSGTKTWTGSNIGASKEAGEPNHMGSQGGKSIWFKLDNYVDYPRKLSFAMSSVNGSGAAPVATTFAVYTGSSLSNLTPVLTSGNTPYFHMDRFTFLAQPNTIYYIAIDGYDTGQGVETGTFRMTYGTAKDEKTADFDKDGLADYAVFRQTTGAWYSIDSSTNRMRAVQWGKIWDDPLLFKDKAENMLYTVYRPTEEKWFTLGANGLSYTEIPFGRFQSKRFIRTSRDSSGRTSNNLALFEDTDGTWWIRNADGTYFGFQFGQWNDIPMCADFDGDGNDEIAVFRPSNGMWYIYNLVTNQYKFIPFGKSGDMPVVSDYDGDSIADIAVFRTSTGTWYVMRSSDGGTHQVRFGQTADIPQPADYDNTGASNYVVFRNGTWWKPLHPDSASAVIWGQAGDEPVTAPRTPL